MKIENRGKPRAYTADGRPICGAKRPNKDLTCQRTPMPNGRCYLHGGASPKGIAHPHFRDGKASKYSHLPERLSEKVKEFLKDPDWVSSKESAAVIDARLTELYSQLNQAEPVDVWRDLIERYNNIEDEDGTVNPLMKEQFEMLLFNGANEMTKAEKVWQDILQLTEQRRKLAETETKMVKNAGQFITAEQFMTFIQLVLMIIKENVTDRRQLAKISESLVSYNVIAKRLD